MSDATPSASHRELDPHELLRVIRAMQRGDLSQRLPSDLPGVGGEIAAALNAHLEQMAHFVEGAGRVSEAIAEGRYGEQIGTLVEGQWSFVKNQLNFASVMVAAQIRALHRAIDRLAEGDLGGEVRVPCRGEMLEIRDRLNQCLADLRGLRAELGWTANEISQRGQLGGWVHAEHAKGEWRTLADEMTAVAQTVTRLVRNANAVFTDVRRGKSGRRITEEVSGELDDLKRSINDLAERLDRAPLAAS
jgi:methyl-accepting chemotaxis protein